MAQISQQLTQKRFGKTIQLYVPTSLKKHLENIEKTGKTYEFLKELLMKEGKLGEISSQQKDSLNIVCEEADRLIKQTEIKINVDIKELFRSLFFVLSIRFNRFIN